MSELGEFIVGARTRAGIDQSELATRVGVKQQTISRWENGKVRPNVGVISRLAGALNVPVNELKTAYERQVVPNLQLQEGPSMKPPLADTLPYRNLYPDQFEEFVAHLYTLLYPTANVRRLGGQGEDQGGYDILVIHDDGRRVGIQCKREQDFGPQKVRQAIDEAELDVDKSIIALSRSATNAAGLEVEKHEHWTLQDQRGLSRLVRSLPLETAIRLVDQHFPHHREAFLGVPLPSPWLTTEQFFQVRPYTLLDHRQPLIGRQELLESVVEWCVDSEVTEKSPIGMLIGRSGLGKSKLLNEISNRVQGKVQFRFLDQGQNPAPDSFDLLPFTEDIVVVIDDAHNIESISSIVGQLRRQRPRAKLLIATRPDSKNKLEDEIAELNITSRSLLPWTLEDLPPDDALSLAAGLLNRPTNDPTVRQLAAISADCPFIAVAAADLIEHDELSGRTFQSSRDLRTKVSKYLVKRSAGPGSLSGQPERKSVLEALTAYQPVRINDPNFREAMTRLTGIASWDLISARISELEDGGLVLRRGTAVRVVPDMLGDILLSNAAYDERSHLPTGFLQRADAAATGTPLQHLLVNASRVDWQVRDGTQTETGMIDLLWESFRDQILTADYVGQILLLPALAKMAYYQPRRSLTIVESVLSAGPITLPGDEATDLFRATRSQVVQAIPPILRNCAYDTDFLNPSMDLLWKMAQQDKRPPNQSPGHPLRVLQQISDLRSGKSYEYLGAVIDIAARWFREPYDERVSPFDVLDPILATDASDEFSSGMTLTLSSFPVSIKETRPLRTRIIEIARLEARGSNPTIAVRAVRTLGQVIRGPFPRYGRIPSNDEVMAWAVEFLPVIAELGKIGTEPERDPVVRIAIREALTWHSDHSETDTRQAAQKAIAALIRSPDDDLADCLHRGYENAHKFQRDGELDFEAMERSTTERFKQATQTLMVNRTAMEILTKLETRLSIQRQAIGNIDGAAIFMRWLFRAHTNLAVALCENLSESEFPELKNSIHYAIGALISNSDQRGIEVSRNLLTPTSIELQRGVAAGLLEGGYARSELLDGELELLVELARHSDEYIRGCTGTAVGRLHENHKPAAFHLLAILDLRGSGHAATETLRPFAIKTSLAWPDVPLEIREKILTDLRECESIDTYEIMSALAQLSAVDPLGVTKLLISRFERESEIEGTSYSALPHQWIEPLKIRHTTQLERCLIEVRNWMIRDDDDGRSPYPDDRDSLYQLIAGEWDDQAIAVLSDLTMEPTGPALIATSRLVSQMPPEIKINNAPLITDILDRAAALGDDHAEKVRNAISKRMITSGVFRIGSGPSPEDIELRDRARLIADGLPYGSDGRRFYESIAGYADFKIRRQSELDEETHDARQW